MNTHHTSIILILISLTYFFVNSYPTFTPDEKQHFNRYIKNINTKKIPYDKEFITKKYTGDKLLGFNCRSHKCIKRTNNDITIISCVTHINNGKNNIHLDTKFSSIDNELILSDSQLDSIGLIRLTMCLSRDFPII